MRLLRVPFFCPVNYYSRVYNFVL